MEREELFKEISVKTTSKILLVVLDGVGGLSYENGKTELEAAEKPNLDKLARESSCGLAVPVGYGITPGSGPAHISLFGFDPLKYQIGRGILEALGLGMEVGEKDVAVRGNFATKKEGLIVDRRAGRISTEKNRELIALLKENIEKIEDVEVILKSGKEHRFAMILRGDGLSDNVTDADPQKEGLPHKKPQALDKDSEKTAAIAWKFIQKAEEVLKGREPANTVLLRGFSKYPNIPSVQEVFKLKAAALATYPMYRGLAKLVGMEVIDCGETLKEQVKTLKEIWNEYDFFYFHYKKTDSSGEDGDFMRKVKAIEEFDRVLPQLLELNPDVIVVTGDHSTPSLMKSHSWHPVPFILKAKFALTDDVRKFTEKECAKGILGIFPAMEAMPLMLANAGKLKKFGA